MPGKNVIYWNEIIRASERSAIIPQSIAAVIHAEAAKYRGGDWKPTSVCKDSKKSTKENTVYKSSAAGMTQFLDSFVRDTVRKLKQQFPAITEPDEHLNARMKIALEYANVFSLKEKMQNITS
ncbi:hypothetical protein DQD89_22225 [Salmonella enterica subsp. enterica]|nr:hypothetical protein [Salmonella enterica subsp. enterica serovar Kedougou]